MRKKRITLLDFGKAIKAVKNGRKVRRNGWSKGSSIFLIGEESGNDTFWWAYWKFLNEENDEPPAFPFLAIKTADEKIVPWLPSELDILSNDWQILPDEQKNLSTM